VPLFNNGQKVYLKEDNNVSQIVDDNTKDWSLWELPNDAAEKAAIEAAKPNSIVLKIEGKNITFPKDALEVDHESWNDSTTYTLKFHYSLKGNVLKKYNYDLRQWEIVNQFSNL
jgi:hypothetical protein